MFVETDCLVSASSYESGGRGGVCGDRLHVSASSYEMVWGGEGGVFVEGERGGGERECVWEGGRGEVSWS